MSGPKLSQAELERRQQEELALQRRIYVSSLMELQENKQKFLNWFRTPMFTELKKKDLIAAADIQKKIEALLAQLKKIPEPDLQSLSTYESVIIQIRQKNTQVLNYIQNLVDQENNRFFQLKNRERKSMEEQKISNLLQNIQSGIPIENLVVTFEFDGELQNFRNLLRVFMKEIQQQLSSTDQEIASLAALVNTRLTTYVRDPDLGKKKEEVRICIENYLNHWQALLLKKKKFEKYYQEYCVLASIIKINPRPLNFFADMETLAVEVERLRDLYRKKDEMDYIATQINEVMIVLGYQFVTSSVLQRKEGSEYDYSLYQADESTGVSIFTDESGAVMMQMTTLGVGAVTQEDIEENYQRQIDFCAAHPDIVDALAQRGVYLKQVNYAPPSKQSVSKQQISQKGSTDVVDRRKRRREKSKMQSMQ